MSLGQVRRRNEDTRRTVRELLADLLDGRAPGIDLASVASLFTGALGALDETEGLLFALFEGSLDPLVLTNREFRFVAVNQAASDLYGLPREALLGRTGSEFLEQPDGVTQTRRTFVEQGQLRGEATIVRPDGSRRMIEYAATANILPDLNLSIMRDVTERVRLEERLRQMERLDSVGGLAAGVAHDFNNLLSVILSYAAIALDQLPAGDPLRGDLELIHDAGQRATSLTRQLLAFSRQQVLVARVLDVNAVVAGMEPLVRRMIREDIELSIAPAPALDHVQADPGQLEQVLLNLVVNARDAMPAGGRLVIETANVEVGADAAERGGVTPGRYVRLTVTDNGIGMDAETRRRVFEPFFTTKPRHQGTGMGMATVFGVVRQSGGHVEVESELGVGTTIRVLLPSSSAPVDGSAEAPPLATGRGSETVLVVEDDPRVRALAATVLRRHGYLVLDAANGGEALLMCEDYQGRIDLLVTDVVMPRMSGRKLATRLLALRPELKVMYMSGYADDSIPLNGVLDAGAVFLQKPLTPESLVRKVREALSRAAAEPA